jgi:pimeloyl-ACP methyl ester carboxylesterase
VFKNSILFFLIFLPVVNSAQFIKKILVEGQGQPIVMLPGGTADISAYTPHAKELAVNYLVIRMEHFNVQFADEGKTLPANYSVKMESEAIGTTLDSLHIKEPVTMVGWSYGAVIALDFALNHPEKIRSLVLFEPPSFWVAKEKKELPEGMQKMQELTSHFGPAAVITEMDVINFRCGLLNCDSIDIKKQDQWSFWLKQKDRLRGLASISKYKNKIKNLNRLNKPVLMMNGSATVVFHKRINELLAAAFPHAIKKEIPGGHNAPVVFAKEFNRTLTDFIKSN